MFNVFCYVNILQVFYYVRVFKDNFNLPLKLFINYWASAEARTNN